MKPTSHINVFVFSPQIDGIIYIIHNLFYSHFIIFHP